MTVLPSPSEQVRYESGVRTKFAGLAFAAGILTVAFLLLQEVGSHGKVAEETVQLLNYHQRFPLDIVGAVLDAIGLLCTAVMLGWLARISRAREPSLQKIPSYLVMVGAPLMAICQLVEIVVISIKANSFATSGAQTYPQAYNLVHSVTGLLNADDNLLRPLGMLLLAVGFVWIVMNAMKVGLLPRPLGYAGVVAGAMEIFQIGPISFVIQGVWLVVVAVLLAGR
ncbi:MAG: hypothetical protein J2O48_11495, partial [Solirubrobacterales bacterium]|nr:hypothetical protein [Solirubrobacterales bacterium]